MKKIVICLFLIVALIFCAAKDEPTVPNLRVISGTQEIEGLSCGYELVYQRVWGETSHIIADCAGVEQVAKEADSLHLKGGEMLKLDFSQVIDHYVIFDWNKQAEIEMQSNDFVAPQDVGTYLYVITAYFGKSEASYVIKIEIESEI